MGRWRRSICVGMWRGRGGLPVTVLFVLVGVRLVDAEAEVRGPRKVLVDDREI